MKLQAYIIAIQSLKKEKEFLNLKRISLLEELKNEEVEISDINRISAKISRISAEIDEKQSFLDDFMKSNFELIDIKIFAFKCYRKLSFEKIGELVNYSAKQVSRRYHNILNTNL